MSLSWSTGRYYWDFSQDGLQDITTLGATGSSITQVANGLQLTQTAASDVKAKLNKMDACMIDGTITLDCTCPNTNQIGICFRTTSFSTSNDSYAWYFGITATGWVFGRGSNSTYASWSQVASGTGNYSGRHKLKVVLSGQSIKCYVDDILVETYSSSTYQQYGYVMPRSYNGDTGIIHTLEILSTSIKDPKVININCYIKVVFDRDVHFPYANMKNYASAFTAQFQQRDSYNSPLYTKTITAIDVVHAKDSQGNDILNTIIVKFDRYASFRKAESSITLYFDSSNCLIYGKYLKDKLANFNLTFTGVTLDMYQNPNPIEQVHIGVNSDQTLVKTPVVTTNVPSLEAMHIVGITTNVITPTLTGTIHP